MSHSDSFEKNSTGHFAMFRIGLCHFWLIWRCYVIWPQVCICCLARTGGSQWENPPWCSSWAGCRAVCWTSTDRRYSSGEKAGEAGFACQTRTRKTRSWRWDSRRTRSEGYRCFPKIIEEGLFTLDRFSKIIPLVYNSEINYVYFCFAAQGTSHHISRMLRWLLKNCLSFLQKNQTKEATIFISICAVIFGHYVTLAVIAVVFESTVDLPYMYHDLFIIYHM